MPALRRERRLPRTPRTPGAQQPPHRSARTVGRAMVHAILPVCLLPPPLHRLLAGTPTDARRQDDVRPHMRLPHALSRHVHRIERRPSHRRRFHSQPRSFSGRDVDISDDERARYEEPACRRRIPGTSPLAGDNSSPEKPRQEPSWKRSASNCFAPGASTRTKSGEYSLEAEAGKERNSTTPSRSSADGGTASTKSTSFCATIAATSDTPMEYSTRTGNATISRRRI